MFVAPPSSTAGKSRNKYGQSFVTQGLLMENTVYCWLKLALMTATLIYICVICSLMQKTKKRPKRNQCLGGVLIRGPDISTAP